MRETSPNDFRTNGGGHIEHGTNNSISRKIHCRRCQRNIEVAQYSLTRVPVLFCLVACTGDACRIATIETTSASFTNETQHIQATAYTVLASTTFKTLNTWGWGGNTTRAYTRIIGLLLSKTAPGYCYCVCVRCLDPAPNAACFVYLTRKRSSRCL